MTRRPRRALLANSLLVPALSLGLLFSGCGGGPSSTTNSGGGSGSGGSGSSGANVVSVAINAGPANNGTDLLYASVTVCVPGSTTQCQTIDGLQVDTGSSGLRILASAFNGPLALPQQMDSSGNPIAECAQFADGETWGPVQTADVTIGGEKAASLPIQIIGSTTPASVATVPMNCSNLGAVNDTLNDLEANGILGVGNLIQDCGPACATSSSFGVYYTCPTTGCVATTEAVANQVANPVAFFATDNNGVIIQLPSLSAPAATLAGTMTFGIGTQSNNALSGQTIYTLDANGNFSSTTFKGTTFNDVGFLDSGSNGIFFLDATTTGLPVCADINFLYCPTSTQTFSAANTGANGATATFNFSVGNGDTLTNNNDSAIPNLAGPNPQTIDWGLPFFFGRTVFVAIVGKTAGSATGPYWAY
jgi:hypothetical protein